MSAVEQYMQIRANIVSALGEALPYMALGLSDYIEESADLSVYSYNASSMAMKSRRGTIGDKSNQVVTIDRGGLSVEIKNIAKLQNGGAGEVGIVESGDKNYRQPYARPFMDEARDAYVDSGEAMETVKESLRTAGFTVD